ncbi:hypothetical protein G3I17_37790 [Streptomyces sp. SID13031]|nr:hypothetical protein [Streptomyces sp. SID13031]
MSEILDPGFVLAQEERQWVHEAVEEAGKVFRRELLRATGGWPLEFLRDRGLKDTLSTEATWKVGYAPDSWSQLTDHLQKRGFELATLVRAGLTTWSEPAIGAWSQSPKIPVLGCMWDGRVARESARGHLLQFLSVQLAGRPMTL